PVPQIPAIPATVTSVSFTAADPTLSLQRMNDESSRMNRTNDPTDPSSFILQPFVVSVMLDDPHPAGSAGMIAAPLALTYDPSILSISANDITLGSILGLGTDWQLSSEVDVFKGQIGITLYSDTATPITSTDGGGLVNIAFHLAPGAARQGLTSSLA